MMGFPIIKYSTYAAVIRKELQSQESGDFVIPNTRPTVGTENSKAKEVKQPKGNSNTVNKLSGVGNFTTFHKLSCFYTNADQLRNKLTELSVEDRDGQSAGYRRNGS